MLYSLLKQAIHINGNVWECGVYGCGMAVMMAAIPDAIDLPDEVPVIADKAYDSDELRERLSEVGFILISPHRKNRTRPATNDGRRLRRYSRRWIVERTLSWIHSFRRLMTRHDYFGLMHEGFVHLGLALFTLSKVLK